MIHLRKFNIFEGRTDKDVRKPKAEKAWDADKKEDFREKIENLAKSSKVKTKRVGSDIEILCDGEMIAQVMFRDAYVGVKKKGVKFVDEFKYTELGKIKSKVGEILKSCSK